MMVYQENNKELLSDESRSLKKTLKRNFYLKRLMKLNLEEIKRKRTSSFEGVKSKIRRRWREKIIEELWLTFASLRALFLRTLNFKKKVNCPIAFKGMTS